MDEYKNKFGSQSLVSDEIRKIKSEQTSGTNNPRYGKSVSTITKEKISQANKGRQAHNKNVPMSLEQKNKLQNVAKERYANGFISPSKGNKKSESEKQQIAESVKQYAIANPGELSSRARKAHKTREITGNPIYGYQTHEDRSRLGKENIKFAQEARRLQKETTREYNLEKANLTLLSQEERTVTLKCNQCNKIIIRDIQILDACRLFKSDECLFCLNDYTSVAENEIKQYLSEYKIVENTRTLISPYEIDIWLPDEGIAIEYCGLYWHSELNGKTKEYHINKYKQLKNQGIHLITIFEDEYVDNRELVLSMIDARLGKYDAVYNARSLDVKEISSSVLNSFLNKYHIQGSGRSQYRYGLYHGDELLSVMSFMRGEASRKNRSTWEINRYATKCGVRIRGGASRLFSRFVKDVSPIEVISYADLRWGEGKVYESIGFERLKDTVSNYWYIKNNAYPLKRWHRFGLRKNETDDPTLTEWENRIKQGWDRIWDCGSSKYKWMNKNA